MIKRQTDRDRQTETQTDGQTERQTRQNQSNQEILFNKIMFSDSD